MVVVLAFLAAQLPAFLAALDGGHVSFTTRGGAEGMVPVVAHVFCAFVLSAIGLGLFAC